VTARDRIRSSWQKLPVAMLSSIDCNWQKAEFAKSGVMGVVCETPGPVLPFMGCLRASAQLPHSCHSCVWQHLRSTTDHSAEFPGLDRKAAFSSGQKPWILIGTETPELYDPLAPTAAAHVQLLFAVDPEQALMIDIMTLTPHEHMQPPIAEPAPGFSQFFQSLPQHRVILADNFTNFKFEQVYPTQRWSFLPTCSRLDTFPHPAGHYRRPELRSATFDPNRIDYQPYLSSTKPACHFRSSFGNCFL